MCERTKQNIKRTYASFRGIVCTIKEQSDPALYKDLTNQGYFYEKHSLELKCLHLRSAWIIVISVFGEFLV